LSAWDEKDHILSVLFVFFAVKQMPNSNGTFGFTGFIGPLRVSANLMGFPFRAQGCVSGTATCLLIGVALMMGTVRSSHAASADPGITVAAPAPRIH
jgi:hypothetical protein